MSQSPAHEPVASPPPHVEETVRPPTPSDADPELVRILDEDYVVDEPSDDDRPQFDDDLDPSDAP